MKKIVKMILPVLAFLVLGGCTAITSTQGTKLSEPSSPVDNIGVVILQGNFRPAPGLVTFMATKSLNQLFPLLPQRIPPVFAENGIKNKTIVAPAQTIEKSQLGDAGLPDFQYLLVISPTSAEYVTYGGNITIYMSATLLDRKNNKMLWMGSIRFFKDGTSKIDDKAADAFAHNILAQLAKDGMLRLKK